MPGRVVGWSSKNPSVGSLGMVLRSAPWLGRPSFRDALGRLRRGRKGQWSRFCTLPVWEASWELCSLWGQLMRRSWSVHIPAMSNLAFWHHLTSTHLQRCECKCGLRWQLQHVCKRTARIRTPCLCSRTHFLILLTPTYRSGLNYVFPV